MTKAQSIVLGATIGPIITHYAFAFWKDRDFSKAHTRAVATLIVGVTSLFVMWVAGV